MTFETRESVTLTIGHQKVFGMLHLPTHGKKVPGVVICHGLAGTKCGSGRIYVKLAEELAKNGIASLRIDFRGCGDSEGNFEDTTVESQIADALLALEYMQHHPRIDPHKIGIYGCSFGGVIALEVAQRSRQIASLAVWAPMFDGEQWLERWDAVKSTNELTDLEKYSLMNFNGIVPGIELLTQMFKLRTGESMKELHEVPFLHIYGGKDDVIDSSHAEKYEKHRDPASAASRFVRFPETTHDFTHPVEQKLALEETINWFCKTLNPR